MKVTQFRKRATWLRARRKLIGASDVPAILGVGYSGKNSLTVYAQKVSEDAGAEEDNDRFLLGRHLESGIMSACKEKLGYHFKPSKLCIYQPDSLEFAGCTPDGFDPDGLPVECKNVGPWNSSEWDDEQTPLMYLVQVQYQLLCTESPAGWLVANIANSRLEVRKIERNEEFLGAALERLREFWQCVVDRRPPEIDGFAACSKALATLYPSSNEYAIELPPESSDWLRKRDEAAAAIKIAESVKTECDNALKACLQDAAYGLASDGQIVSWRTVERKGYTVAPSRSRQLRMIDKLPLGIPLTVRTESLPFEMKGTKDVEGIN